MILSEKTTKFDVKAKSGLLNFFWPSQKISALVDHLLMIFRFEFYNRAKTTFAIVATGESAAYGTIILKKGVVSENQNKVIFRSGDITK